MKITCFLLLLILFMSFTNFRLQEKKYLPVFISMYDTTFYNTELLLNLKAAFGIRKIKTISKKDAEMYIYNEAYSVMESYYKSGGDLGDINKRRSYEAANMRTIANSLLISIRISADWIVNDTVKWDSHTIPINFQNPPKTHWHYILLDSTNSKTLQQLSQSIVDSILASNILVKD